MRGLLVVAVLTLLGAAPGLAAVATRPSSCGRRPLSPGWWQPRPIDPATVRVADGDTFRAGGETFRLRGIDAPELREPQGPAARHRLAALLRGGVIHVVPRAEDVYCRTVADVYVNGRNVADLLRQEGLVKPRPPRRAPGAGRAAGPAAPGSTLLAPSPGDTGGTHDGDRMTMPRQARRPVPDGTRSTLGASVIVALGLLLTLASTGLPLAIDGPAGASLRVRLPDAVRLAVLVLLGLSGLAWLSLLGSRPVRRLDLAEYRRLRRRSLVAGLALPLAVLAYAVWAQRQGGEGRGIEAPFAVIRSLLDLLAQGRKPATSSTLVDLVAATLTLGLALACFSLFALVALAGRAPRGPAGEAAPETPATLRQPVTVSLGNLRADPDARRAIVRAWLRFEEHLARGGTARAPWQTAAEFVRAALGRLPLPVAPVVRLAALFEVARFSDRPLGQDARDAACDCLEEIGAALPRGAARAR